MGCESVFKDLYYSGFVEVLRIVVFIYVFGIVLLICVYLVKKFFFRVG